MHISLSVGQHTTGPFQKQFVIKGLLTIRSQCVYNKKSLVIHCKQEKFEDTKWVIIIRISKKNRQHNGQKKKHKKTNNDLQNIYIKLTIE